jgi:hypothetical protein
LTSIKEAVFWNFELAYLLCRLHPPAPPIFQMTRRITRKAEFTVVLPLKMMVIITNPWDRVILENLTGSQLAKNFPTFYET